MFPAEGIFGTKSDNTVQTTAAHPTALLPSTEHSYTKKLMVYISDHTRVGHSCSGSNVTLLHKLQLYKETDGVQK